MRHRSARTRSSTRARAGYSRVVADALLPSSPATRGAVDRLRSSIGSGLGVRIHPFPNSPVAREVHPPVRHQSFVQYVVAECAAHSSSQAHPHAHTRTYTHTRTRVHAMCAMCTSESLTLTQTECAGWRAPAGRDVVCGRADLRAVRCVARVDVRCSAVAAPRGISGLARLTRCALASGRAAQQAGGDGVVIDRGVPAGVAARVARRARPADQVSARRTQVQPDRSERAPTHTRARARRCRSSKTCAQRRGSARPTSPSKARASRRSPVVTLATDKRPRVCARARSAGAAARAEQHAARVRHAADRGVHPHAGERQRAQGAAGRAAHRVGHAAEGPADTDRHAAAVRARVAAGRPAR